MKVEYIVVYDNSSDTFDIGHCWIKVKVPGENFEIFPHLPEYKLSGQKLNFGTI